MGAPDSAGEELVLQPPGTVTSRPGKKRKQDLPENILEEQIGGFMRARNWTRTRNHVGTFVPLGFILRQFETLSSGSVDIESLKQSMMRNLARIGTKGQPDYVFTRPRFDAGFALFQKVWIECKAPGKKPRPEQAEWIRNSNLMGEPANWFDGFDKFIAWYKEIFES